MELGWNTYRSFWRKGFASEAVAAAKNYAIEVRRESRIRALITHDNESSLSLAKRLDLTFEAEIEVRGKAMGIYTHQSLNQSVRL